ncbi:hypothetical protein BDZ45DRAFT_733775 [Acephala macrosclerotiorum]|nr:hypothetical protein BDZ45DRAFT_733775 [Acephala macrosclerotiorum]
MSFGWLAGDIVSGISTLVKVGKALRESGGAASEYRETIAFLTSVETTLRGLNTIVATNPDLTWKDELVEQAGLLKSAVDDFKTKVDKYDLSLGSASERKKARRILREVQFALSDKVKELRIVITQPQLVLDVFISLQTLYEHPRTSILDLSKSSSISQENLQSWTDEMAQVLPTMIDSLATFQQVMQTEILEVKTTHQTAHTRVQDDLSQIKDCLGELKDFQTTLLTQSAVAGQDLRRWQGEFQQTTQALCTCTKDQLELLLMNRRKPVETVRESGISSLQVAMRTLQIFASGLASGIGTLTALSLYASNNPPIRPSLLPLQRRGVTDTSMTYDLAPDDGRWDEAFQLAAESPRDGTWNRLWKGLQNLPVAPVGAQSNEEFITKLEAHIKNRKDFRNYAAAKFEVGHSVWLTIPKESSVKVEVVARRREDIGEYLYQVKDTSGVLYEDEKGKWVSQGRLTKF